jgi:hypothetical protein
MKATHWLNRCGGLGKDSGARAVAVGMAVAVDGDGVPCRARAGAERNQVAVERAGRADSLPAFKETWSYWTVLPLQSSTLIP